MKRLWLLGVLMVIMTGISQSFHPVTAFSKDVVYTYVIGNDSELSRVKHNEFYEASISPGWKRIVSPRLFGKDKVSRETTGCEYFLLTIKNNSLKDITVVWDKTLFIDKMQTRGSFMFEGVRYLDKDAPKPSDIVLAGGTLTKDIYPSILVDHGSYRWWHQTMKDGIYGVYLTVDVDGKSVPEKLTMQIQKEPLPDEEQK